MLKGREGPYGHYKKKPLECSALEIEVLQLISEGYPRKEMAAKLSVSNKTIEYKVRRICDKLGAQNITHAVAIGISRGLVNVECLIVQ